MAKNNADVEMMIHTRQAHQALSTMANKWRNSHRQMGNAQDKVNRKARRSNDQFAIMGKTMKGMIRNVASFAAGWVGVSQVVSLVRAEIDAIAEQQQRSQQSVLSYSEVMQSILFQTPEKKGGIADMSYNEIRDAIDEAPVADKAALARAVLGAISSDATSPVSERVASAIELAELRPELQKNQSALQSLTEAVVGQKRLFGGTTGEQMMMVQLGQQVSRVTDTEAFAKYIGPAVEKLKDFGFSQSEGLALASAYSSAAVDPTGETTQTNLVKVMGQLYEVIRARTKRDDVTGMAMIDMIQSKTKIGQDLRNYMIGVMQDELTPDQLEAAAKFKSGKTKGRSAGKIAFFNLFQADGVGEDGTMKSSLRAANEQIPKTLDAARQALSTIEQIRLRDPLFLASKAQNEADVLKAGLETNTQESVRESAINAITELSRQTQGTNLYGQLSGFKQRIVSRKLSPVRGMALVQEAVTKRAAELQGVLDSGEENTWLTRLARYQYGVNANAISESRESELKQLVEVLNRQSTRIGELVTQMKDAREQPKLPAAQEPEAKVLGQ